MNNFQRTAAWLHACGKTPSPGALSVQIGCDLEETAEFLRCLFARDAIDRATLARVAGDLELLGARFKQTKCAVFIPDFRRAAALDALCDREVTGNGVAYLAGMDKDGADKAVLDSNDAKLVDGKPVLLPGGKIGKPAGWAAPTLETFV